MRGYGQILLNPTGNAFSSSGSAVTTTQPVLFPDGTAAAPSISFSSNSNTGFFWNGSGDFRTTNNGTSKLSFNANGISPVTDDAISLGQTNARWTAINTRNITIATSLSNAAMGVVTLSGAAGSAIIYNNAITSTTTSVIILSKLLGRGTQGSVAVTTSAAGQATIASTSTTDTSTVLFWVIPTS